jgi:hypothetical protein
MLCLNRRVQRIAQSGSAALFLILGIVHGAALSGCGHSASKAPIVSRNQATAQPPTVQSQPSTREEQTPSGLLKLQDFQSSKRVAKQQYQLSFHSRYLNFGIFLCHSRHELFSIY